MRRLLLLCVLVAAISSFVIVKKTVLADPGGRSATCGYFTGTCRTPDDSSSYFYGEAIVDGFPSGTAGFPGDPGSGSVGVDKQAFINFVEGRRNGSGRDKTGAEFIIQLMRGGTDHDRPDNNDVQDWKNRINSSSITISREDALYNFNSGWMRSPDDDAFYGNNATRDSIVIRHNGNIVFKLKYDCANPVGELPGVPPAESFDTGLRITLQGVGAVTMSSGVQHPSASSWHTIGNCNTPSDASIYVSGSRDCYAYHIGPNGLWTPVVDGYTFTGWSGCDSTDNSHVCYINRYDSGWKYVTATYVPAGPTDAPVHGDLYPFPSCSYIQGWAFDGDGPTWDLGVEIYIDGSYWTTLSAGQVYTGSGVESANGYDDIAFLNNPWGYPGYRPELTDPTIRFSMAFPESKKDNQSHRIEAYARNRNSSGNETGSTTKLNPWDTNRQVYYVTCPPPDTAPTIAIVNPACSSDIANDVYFQINTSDSDRPGSSYQVEYQIGSDTTWRTVNGLNPSIYIDPGQYSPYDSHQLRARTRGLKPDGTAGSTYVNATHGFFGRSASQGCIPRSFSVSNPAATITLNDIENPSSASIGGSFDLAFTPGGGRVSLGGNLTYYVLRVNGIQTSLGSRNIANTYTGNTVISPSNIAVSGLSAGDRVCAVLRVDPRSGQAYSDGAFVAGTAPSPSYIESIPPACATVVNKPYLKVFRGDVMAGGAMSIDGQPCTNLVNGEIKLSYSGTDPNNSSNWRSSTQYAAFAMGKITAFSSASLRTSGSPPIAPSGFTFGNTTATNLGHYAPTGSGCLPDFFGLKDGLELPANWLDVSQQPTDGSFSYYTVTGDTTLPSLIVPQGRRVVIFVDGDVRIDGDISYENVESRTVRSQVQALYLVVSGNISIAPGVNTLHGIFIAQPSDETGGDGIIDTCAGLLDYAACNTQLRVFGGLVARDILFHRTYSSLRNAAAGETLASAPRNCETGGSSATCAAEVIQFDPSIVLIGSPFDVQGRDGRYNYDTFVELPPNF